MNSTNHEADISEETIEELKHKILQREKINKIFGFPNSNQRMVETIEQLIKDSE